MTEPLRTSPYPVFAIIAGPFLSHLAAHRGLGTVGRALVVGLGVLVLASVLAVLISAPSHRGHKKVDDSCEVAERKRQILRRLSEYGLLRSPLDGHCETRRLGERGGP